MFSINLDALFGTGMVYLGVVGVPLSLSFLNGGLKATLTLYFQFSG